MVSTWRSILRLMKSAPVLCAVISSVTMSAPDELADQLAARARGAGAQQVDAVADLVADLGQPRVDDFDGTRVGLRVDLLHHGAGAVDDHEVGAHRADVDAHVRVDPVAVLRPRVRLGHVAQQHDALHRKRLGDGEVGSREAAGVEGALGGRPGFVELGLDERRADRSHREVGLGHEQVVALELEGLAHRLHGALVGRDAADERDRRLHELALGDRASEVADHGVAQPAQHLGRLIALLLGVDHVALGEHAAASGDAGGLAGAQDDVADILDVVEQAARLLVDEGARARGAVAVRLIVDDTGAAQIAGLETDELGRLAAHLEHGDRVWMQHRDAARDGLELVLEPGLQSLADEAAARARDADAGRPRRQHSQQLVEQGLRRLPGAALDAPVGANEERPARDEGHAVGRGLEQLGVVRNECGEKRQVVSLADECRLETDAADVDAKRSH